MTEQKQKIQYDISEFLEIIQEKEVQITLLRLRSNRLEKGLRALKEPTR